MKKPNGYCPACKTDLGSPPRTLRDDFAIAALAGFLANHELFRFVAWDKQVATDTTRDSYWIADAMIEARKK